MVFVPEPPAPSAQISLLAIGALAAPEDVAEARVLLREYAAFLAAHPHTARFCSASLEAEAIRLPHSFLEQGGGCLLARDGQAAGGFLAWRQAPVQVASHAWELKRLWVRPAFRRLGMGRALLEESLRRAVDADCKTIFLDTVPAPMAAAVALYRQLGFEPCPPYNGGAVEGLAYYRKAL